MRLVRSGGLHDPLRAAARRLKRSGDRNCSSERGWTRPAIRKRVRGHDGDLFATVQLSLGARRYPRAATQESSSFQESEIFSWRPRYSDWPGVSHGVRHDLRSEEHTSELQSLMSISYAVFCLKKKQETQLQTVK